MPFDSGGHYHAPPRQRSYMQRKIEEHDRMGEPLPEIEPMSVKREIAAMTATQRCARFNSMTRSEMHDVSRTTEAMGEWDRLTWMALALAAIARLTGGYPDPAPCADICNSSCDCTPCEQLRETEAVQATHNRNCVCAQCIRDGQREYDARKAREAEAVDDGDQIRQFPMRYND